ncbi:MAG: hypothetical protein BWY64_00143 [bacterium ADurb.Bin363]|nr:MAG: hypothetical protein BWY64_00143 [bacterium ADurb.Bin363]
MLKFNKTLFNPFDYIKSENVRKKVNNIKDRHPEWEKEDICRELIRQKARMCGTTGALSALPSSLPGLGTFMTLIGGTAVDITSMVYFLSELTLEIATVYNRDPSTEATTKESFWVLSSCFGVEAATVGISKVTVINASKKALAILVEKLLTIIGGWLAKRIILKMIPLAGSFVNASINMSACKQVGKEAVLWYKTNTEQDSMWNVSGETKKEFWEEDEEEEDEKREEQDIPVENIILEPMNEDVKEEVIVEIIVEEKEKKTEPVPAHETEKEKADIPVTAEIPQEGEIKKEEKKIDIPKTSKISQEGEIKKEEKKIDIPITSKISQEAEIKKEEKKIDIPKTSKISQEAEIKKEEKKIDIPKTSKISQEAEIKKEEKKSDVSVSETEKKIDEKNRKIEVEKNIENKKIFKH